ncbi:helix-turn-helix domain-containing protein [Intrasporangium calvum]|uniref:Helix-turn-helix domain-containing protein n=1 Tax=Intrasporangium calvum TaxID=53358 RepID=A0ABT5GDX8_9MICO|nr:helix-turn-helix domain-containing protein [Intrasporangium calvum]MDC5696464.1 helix-turn-helix domain-containing protein [Intrasporangium calvum]
MDELLTLREVADWLRVPEATLRWWRHCRQGPASFRLGRRVMYRQAAVERWLQEQAAGDPTAQASSTPRRRST